MSWCTIRQMICIDGEWPPLDERVAVEVERWLLVIKFKSGGFYSYISTSRKKCLKEVETIYG